MVIKVLPLLCAQAGPESQVTFDGPMLCGSWSLLPTESVKLSIDQIVSCLLLFSHLPLGTHRFRKKTLGQDLGIKLNCLYFRSIILSSLELCTGLWSFHPQKRDNKKLQNIWGDGVAAPSTFASSGGIYEIWICLQICEIWRQSLSNAVIGNICDLGLIQWEETG